MGLLALTTFSATYLLYWVKTVSNAETQTQNTSPTVLCLPENNLQRLTQTRDPFCLPDRTICKKASPLSSLRKSSALARVGTARVRGGPLPHRPRRRPRSSALARVGTARQQRQRHRARADPARPRSGAACARLVSALRRDSCGDESGARTTHKFRLFFQICSVLRFCCLSLAARRNSVLVTHASSPEPNLAAGSFLTWSEFPFPRGSTCSF